MFPYILLVIIFCIFSSCRNSGPKEESETIDQGRLYTLNHGEFSTYIASDDWVTMNYGFDAIADQSNAYLSIESNSKSNTFLLLATVNHIDKYSVKSDNNAISLSRSSAFRIPNPVPGRGDLRAVRYTATSGANVGAEKLTVYRKMEIKSDQEVPLETLVGEDRDFWGIGWDFDDPFKNPITLDVKIYNQTVLPTAYVYKLYGTTADITDVEDDVNKILAQAASKIQAVSTETWPYADKGWDLNGNGKLDIYCQAGDGVGEEFQAIKVWAKDLKLIWNDDKIGVAILEQDFEIHDNGGVPINGISDENFVVLPGNVNNRNFCHEYLHCDLARDMKDIDDEFNVMHYADDFGQKRLRYRPVTVVTGTGGSEIQWNKLTGVSY